MWYRHSCRRSTAATPSSLSWRAVFGLCISELWFYGGRARCDLTAPTPAAEPDTLQLRHDISLGDGCEHGRENERAQEVFEWWNVVDAVMLPIDCCYPELVAHRTPPRATYESNALGALRPAIHAA